MAVLEICANSLSSAKAAQDGGAQRVELCDNMAEGGTTPSYAQMKLCKEKLAIEIWPIIRPRGGDFLYNNEEFDLMKEDIKICKALNCNGAVTGILLANGYVDKVRCKELVELAKPMPLAFHRAIDMSRDLSKSLEDIIELGFIRILTSGGKANVIEGLANIKTMIAQAGKRIEIMPGAGINPDNIKQLKEETSAKNFHSSARVWVKSKMEFLNKTTKMGDGNDEYGYEQSNVNLIKRMVEELNS